MKAECPECGAMIGVEEDAMEGEIVTCRDCGAELEIVSVDPLEFDLAPSEMEDWGE